MATSQKLVIVESPAKAKTISKYLGEDYTVLASVGHIRDLVDPKDLPAEKKKGSLGKFSIDIENDFEPYYAISPGKSKTVSDLKKALSGAEELFLATDDDRHGDPHVRRGRRHSRPRSVGHHGSRHHARHLERRGEVQPRHAGGRSQRHGHEPHGAHRLRRHHGD